MIGICLKYRLVENQMKNGVVVVKNFAIKHRFIRIVKEKTDIRVGARIVLKNTNYLINEKSILCLKMIYHGGRERYCVENYQ